LGKSKKSPRGAELKVLSAVEALGPKTGMRIKGGWRFDTESP